MSEAPQTSHSDDILSEFDPLDGSKRTKIPVHISEEQSAHSPPSAQRASALMSADRDARGSSSPASLVDVPFDFQKFLEQMKTKSADPIAKYLRR